MKEKRKKTAKRAVLCVLILCLALADAMAALAYDAGTVILPAYDLEATPGCIQVGVRGTYITQAQEALQRINAIRLEACREGVPDPRDESRRLTEADYVPLQWSAELEKIARLRAAEASIRPDHQRPNGKSCWSIWAEELFDTGEVLAWNWSNSMTDGIEQWYAEKSNWVRQNTSAVTGHYTSMINPGNTYVGLGCFTSDYGAWYNTTCGRFGNDDLSSVDTTMRAGIQDCIQTIEVPRTALMQAGLVETSGNDSVKMNVGSKRFCEFAFLTEIDGDQACVIDLHTTWESSAPEIASVDAYGCITALRPGEATVTATSGIGETLKAEITVTAKVASVSLPSRIELAAGKSTSLKAEILPENAENKSLSWSSSNKSIATVSSKGKVTAKKPGKVTITAKTKDGSNKKATCTVIVVPKKMSAPTLAKAGSKKLKITWKKQSSVSGYQVQYSTKKSFAGAKTKTAGAKTSLTISGLKKKKTYYVRVRAYKKIGGKPYYGAWSTAKKRKL